MALVLHFILLDAPTRHIIECPDQDMAKSLPIRSRLGCPIFGGLMQAFPVASKDELQGEAGTGPRNAGHENQCAAIGIARVQD
ncbi:hypothetical protein [Bradyrhizobium sp.]|jgi:hypothetical protein|uniref:hypothetical protein n=1 Tax=Bradyrhizobium sp. TaxID=376 RepID=UPI003C260E01